MELLGKGLSTATDTSNDLDKTIMFLADEFVQICISFHYHVSALLMDKFTGERSFVHQTIPDAGLLYNLATNFSFPAVPGSLYSLPGLSRKHHKNSRLFAYGRARGYNMPI